jgi:iron complex transport system permease protein
MNSPVDTSQPIITTVHFVVSVLLLLVAAMCSVAFGATSVSLLDIFSDEQARIIVLDLRLPRVVFGVCVGGGLAVVGAVYQAIFRNALASPFSLGVSSGAALGASIALMSGAFGIYAAWGVSGASVVGAVVSIIVVSRLAELRPVERGSFLLLIGIVFSFFCSSLLTLLQYLSDYSQLFRVTRWMMGGIGAVTFTELAVVACATLGATVWLWRKSESFDLMLFGDEMAAIKGVDVPSLYREVFFITSMVVGLIVSFCGVIGFVGIVVPAMTRLMVGLSHRVVLPISFLLGAFLVVTCDLLGRVVVPPYEVPVGVFTSVIGGPAFVWLLVRARQGQIL